MKNVHLSTKSVAYTAIMTAFVAVATMVLKIQTGESYTNLGDAMIFLTAAYFGPIPALIAGGLGSFIADLITYPLTMWFTLIIKSVEGLIAGMFVFLANKIYIKSNKTKNNNLIKYIIYIIGMVISGLWMVGGYYITKAFIYGTKETALISLTKNFIQMGLSLILTIVLYIALYPAMKNLLNLKNRTDKQELLDK